MTTVNGSVEGPITKGSYVSPEKAPEYLIVCDLIGIPGTGGTGVLTFIEYSDAGVGSGVGGLVDEGVPTGFPDGVVDCEKAIEEIVRSEMIVVSHAMFFFILMHPFFWN
jgi:hypothetical protein